MSDNTFEKNMNEAMDRMSENLKETQQETVAKLKKSLNDLKRKEHTTFIEHTRGHIDANLKKLQEDLFGEVMYSADEWRKLMCGPEIFRLPKAERQVPEKDLPGITNKKLAWKHAKNMIQSEGRTHRTTTPPEPKKIPSPTVKISIESEAWRRYTWMCPKTNKRSHHRIHKPAVLKFNIGGETHIVTDIRGITHCVPAPGVYGCVLTWRNKAVN